MWYENLSGVVSCPENSNINTDGLDISVRVILISLSLIELLVNNVSLFLQA